MPRPTREQIDDEIVDAAAGLFARLGLRQTSLQAVADAVGYSKTGLLHRFGSKDGLRAAVGERLRREVDELVASADGLPAGPGRDRALVEAVVDLALRRPGACALVLGLAVRPQLEEGQEDATVTAVADALLAAFGLVPGDPTPDLPRAVRVVGALGAVATTVVGLPDQDPAVVRPHLVQTAYDALGHAGPGSRS
ncbi:TetR/AcrR family transcriptional regulator [Vallicoccus soli]|uniref:TetR/AcrR family transcriptional regulator n=1 Tax=Vallicoccus soli TaxID=2339232 RepID=A0A3A3YZC4_9ACTN|nr:TetR/AcrR family transcriptional regulator [Vallicoccus soli]RJK96100.1 TetR/AcrR family transcriptional regulator [Vallicoccus soli]